jgi:hypothetical protein
MSLIAARARMIPSPQQLPKIAPTPDFMLISRDGALVTTSGFSPEKLKSIEKYRTRGTIHFIG